jgi:hypothetical protein
VEPIPLFNKISLRQLTERTNDTKGGQNKETIMLTIASVGGGDPTTLLLTIKSI